MKRGGMRSRMDGSMSLPWERLVQKRSGVLQLHEDKHGPGRHEKRDGTLNATSIAA